MADLINRDAFITYLKTARASAYLNELADCDTEEAKWCINDEMCYSTQSFIDVLKCRPTVDAVPVVHGHWVDRQLTDPENKRVELDSNGLVCSSAYCSVCGEWLVASDEYAPFGLYCPHCGAKMDEEGEQDVRSDS